MDRNDRVNSSKLSILFLSFCLSVCLSVCLYLCLYCLCICLSLYVYCSFTVRIEILQIITFSKFSNEKLFEFPSDLTLNTFILSDEEKEIGQINNIKKIQNPATSSVRYPVNRLNEDIPSGSFPHSNEIQVFPISN